MPKSPGRGKFSANLEVTRGEITRNAPAKKGIEVIREKFQADADSEAEDCIRIVDHDANRVVWSGTAAEHKALKKALSQED
jgi:hypothetical protein